MTVISTLLTKTCTVHCTDSFITARKITGAGFDYLETKQSKIIAVEQYKGAMSYFHLALQPADNPEWNTFDFLQDCAFRENKPAQAEEYALYVQDRLNKEAIPYCKQANMGIGIHFTVYEDVEGYSVPEMFYISNISGIDPQTGYYVGFNSEFSVGRHSFFTISGEPVSDEHRQPAFRRAVKAHLDLGRLLWFNNGDPALFNQTANALANMTKILAARQMLNDTEGPVKFFSNLALQPVVIVSKIQADFCKKDMAVVGGKCHQLTVSSSGDYSSETGLGHIGGLRFKAAKSN